MYRSKVHWIPSLVLIVAAVALCLTGCSKKSTLDDDATPTNSTLSVQASPTSIATSETSIIEATVSNAGVGVANQVVYFSVIPSTAGSFTPQLDTTGTDGVAAAVFTASNEGTATAWVSVQGTNLSTSINLSVSGDDDTTSTGNGSINATVSHDLLLASGQDTSQVSIVVRDDLGQAAPESTLVKFTAGEKFVDVDGNGYWSENIDSLVFDANGNGNWDPFGIIPSSAMTVGATGTAVVDYVSGVEAYTVYIKVTVDAPGISGSVDLAVQLTPNAELNSIYLASDSISLAVQHTGGIESGTIRATGYDVYGNTVPEGMPIVFVILDGPDGGERLGNLDTAGPDTVYTNSDGVAMTTLHSGTVSGTVRIRAYSDVVMSNATLVLIAAGPPAYCVIGAAECNVPYWDDVAETNNITAIVSDIYLNPCIDSTVVYFSTDEGTMMSHQGRIQGGNGIATSTWFSGNNVVTADGDVIIIAETAGGTVADTGLFFNTYIPAVMTLSGTPASLPADGSSKAYFMIEAVDLNDNWVVGGTPYDAEAYYVGVGGGTFENGCWGASDRVMITSTVLEVDNSRDGVSGNDDGIGAVDVISFWHEGGASVSFSLPLTTGFAYSG
ncbi:MAG: hypothetical protein KKA42_08685, partial [candidate division Zixibacteria bacterium]|nr:hypothetical protein [candidate division Zixibacteria bacterium]